MLGTRRATARTRVTAHVRQTLKIVTPGGYVAFVVADDWVVLSMQSKLPMATAAFQIPNSADAGTPESTNLLLRLYDPKSESARAAFDSAVKSYGTQPPVRTEFGSWTLYQQESSQNDVPYTILDAKSSNVGDVSVSARLAWPHLKQNPADYDARMAALFRSFLTNVEGKLGAYVPQPGEVTRRPGA